MSEERPDACTDEVWEYMECLPGSGIPNFFVAIAWIEEQFGLARDAARDCVLYWMHATGRGVNDVGAA